MRHEEIEIAVPVEIGKSGARAPTRRLEPGAPEPERPVSPILVEKIRSHPRHQQVGVPVVVVIGGHRTHPESLGGGRNPEPGGLADIPKTSVAFIAVQRAHQPRRPARPGHFPALHEEEVRRTVAVVVEHRQARPHRLYRMPVAPRAPLVLEGETGLHCHVPQHDLRGCGLGLDEHKEKRCHARQATPAHQDAEADSDTRRKGHVGRRYSEKKPLRRSAAGTKRVACR